MPHLPLAQLVRTALVVWAFLAPWSSARAQDRVTLRPVANVAGNVVRVGDIADVQGPPALGDAVVIPDLRAEASAKPDGVTIDLMKVRAALEKVAGVNWGRLTLSGVPCRVRASSAVVEDERPNSAPPREPSDGTTMREQVTAWVARSLGIDAADLRLTFDDANADFLDSSSRGQTLMMRSLGASDKLSISVTAYRGDVIATSTTIRVTPLIRREVATAARRISRGDAIASGALAHDVQWLPPSVTPILPEALEGVIARSTIDAGAVIRAEHIEQPVVVKKGEIVTVDCVSGGVVVRAMARAMAQAKDGEVIAFQYLESKRSFNARVNGPGRAVLVVDSGAVPMQSATKGKTARTTDKKNIKGQP